MYSPVVQGPARRGLLPGVLGFALLWGSVGPGIAAQDPGPGSGKKAENRNPVPDPAKQKEAEKQIKDLFKSEYAKKKPEEKQAFARQLLGQAKEVQGDLPTQWVLFREAQDLAAQIGDLELAIEAADAASLVFEISPQGTRIAALGSAGKNSKSQDDLGKLADLYLKVVDAALESDDFENADKGIAGAGQTAKKLASAPLSARITARSKEVADQKARFDKVKKALDALAKDPSNPAANLEVGLYHCFTKNAWDAGLPFLAKGSDPVLQSVATRELARPTEAGAQVELADGWWDLAEKERNEPKQRQYYLRATTWYEQALPGSTSLLKTKIQTRLEAQRKRVLSREGFEVVFNPKATSRGIEVRECGDGLYEAATIGGKPCIKLTRANPQDVSRYLYLKLSEPWQESWKAAEVEVEYYDDGPGPFDVQYDGTSSPYKSVPKNASVGTTKAWKVFTAPIPEPMFRGRQNAAADLRINRTPGSDFYIHRVTIRLVLK